MPRAWSGDEGDSEEAASSPELAPRRSRKKTTKDQDASEDEEQNSIDPDEEPDEEDDDENAGDELYVVEKILAHKVQDDGELSFKVKWEGYEKKEDQTWEPEDNLVESAQDVLDEYLRKVGGREKILAATAEAKSSKRKRSRPSNGTPVSTTKRARKTDEHPSESEPTKTERAQWRPPPGSWEEHIKEIDANEDDDTKKLVVYITWKDGKKTQHPTEVVYNRCPQRMLRFYEKHIRIIREKPTESVAVGNADAEETEDEKMLV